MSQHIGREIAGYRIMEAIGAGGMAQVFKAFQPAFDRFVALKILPEQYAQDETYTQRFIQEAKIIAKLEHKHILPVYDFGEEDGVTYLAMRYLQAGTLKDLLLGATGHQLPLADTARIISQTAQALDAAHQQGIVHRDVKPANILIDAHGDAFLTDFGIAKVLEATSHLTKEGSALGTPAYMSPEQGKGSGQVDARSDVYSLGVILYQMLTGRVPFEADTPLAVVLSHSQKELPIPTNLNPEIPEEIEQVILKALAKEADDRYQTAGEMAGALEQALGEELPEASTKLVELSGGLAADKPAEGVTLHDRQTARQMARQGQVRKALPWGLGALAVLALIGTLFFVGRWNRQALEADATAGELETQAALPSATVDIVEVLESEPTATLSFIDSRRATATQAHFNYEQTLTSVAIYGTSTPLATLTPRPTITPNPNTIEGQALLFILDAMQRSPDYQEDFGDSGSGWETSIHFSEGYEDGAVGYEDGAYFLYALPAQFVDDVVGGQITGIAVTPPVLQNVTNFILQIEGRFIEGYPEANWQIGFTKRDEFGFGVIFHYNGDFGIGQASPETGYRNIITDRGWITPHRRTDLNRVTLVHVNGHVVLFIDGQWSVNAYDDSPYSVGDIRFSLNNHGDAPARAQIDNLRFWDLSDMDVEISAP